MDIPLTMEAEIDPRTGSAYPPVAVGFGLMAVEDPSETERAGRPVYKDTVFVKICVPGDRNSVVLQPATETHKRRFPRAWAAYERCEHESREGTPLEQWPAMSRSMALTLRGLNVHTVEALAEVHDGHLDMLGWDAREWRAKARAYLAVAKDTAEAQKISAENESLKEMITKMQAEIARLSALYEAGGEEQPKKAARR